MTAQSSWLTLSSLRELHSAVLHTQFDIVSHHSTGYLKIREVTKEILGEDVIDKTDEVYGMDDEGEIQGSYRPCGHPGVSGTLRTSQKRAISHGRNDAQLWFATGDFNHSRTLSKALVRLQWLMILCHVLRTHLRGPGVTD